MRTEKPPRGVHSALAASHLAPAGAFLAVPPLVDWPVPPDVVPASRCHFSPDPPRNFFYPAILLLLSEGPGHGYRICEELSGFGFGKADRPSVYRTLNELERDGLVESTDEVPAAGTTRHVYRVTAAGEEALQAWMSAMAKQRANLDLVLLRYWYMSAQRVTEPSQDSDPRAPSQAPSVPDASAGAGQSVSPEALGGPGWSQAGATASAASDGATASATGGATTRSTADTSEHARSTADTSENRRSTADTSEHARSTADGAENARSTPRGLVEAPGGQGPDEPASTACFDPGSLRAPSSERPRQARLRGPQGPTRGPQQVPVGAAAPAACGVGDSALSRPGPEAPKIEWDRARFVVAGDRSSLTIEARSSVGPIAFTTSGLSGWLDVAVVDGLVVMDPPPAARLEVRVVDLCSGNALYDAELARRVDARRFPSVVAELSTVSQIGGGNCYLVGGELTMHGVGQPLQGMVTITVHEVDRRQVAGGPVGDRRLTVIGQQVLDIRHFGMDVPTIGWLRIYPDVRIHLHLEADSTT